MKELVFSYNWNNKLDCKFFTTIRLSNRFEIGDEVIVRLRDKRLKKAIVRDKRVIKLNQINPFIAGLDTGYSVEETKEILKKMYPNANWDNQPIYFYLFETIKIIKQ